MSSRCAIRAVTPVVLASAFALLGGCFDEPIREVDLVGTVRISASAVPDVRDIGVVYVGVYPGWSDDVLGYAYPTMGPVVGSARLGDTYPYGGTTIGSFAYACYQALKCEVVTGRYATLEDLVCAHGLTAEGATEDCSCSPGDDGSFVIDEGSGCLSPDDFWTDCADYYGFTDPEELDFVGKERLAFEKVEDGGEEFWEAEYRIWHVVPFANAVLYAFADNDGTSCNPEGGSINRKRDRDGGQFFYEGTHFNDVLNFPDKYLTSGDVLSEEPVVLTQSAVDAATAGAPEITERPEVQMGHVVLDYVR